MARAEKYRIQFISLDNHNCTLEFHFEGFTGAYTNLVAGPRPFVLQEFNSDEDLFKPIRPQLATMDILASSSGVTMDDFLVDKDSDVLVIFRYGNDNAAYWHGFLDQSDFTETWIDTNHVLTLRATEGLGQLQNFNLTNNGAEITAKTTPLDYLKYATQKSVLGWNKHYIFNNLFHSSMTDSLNNSPLDQCKVDPKTFQIQSTEYEDCYTVINKVNRAFNQTMFQYNTNWWVMRQEELYIPETDNLRGYEQNGATRTAIQTRYDIQVGVNEDVKPISPEMLRFIKRKTKKDEVELDYQKFPEIVKNGTFARGSLIGTTSTLKQYNVDTWLYKQGDGLDLQNGSTPSSGTVTRNEIYESATGPLIANFVRIPTTTGSPVNNYFRWIASDPVYVFANDKISVQFDHKYLIQTTPPTLSRAGLVFIACIYLEGAANNYFLKENGEWELASSVLAQERFIKANYLTSSSDYPTNWNTYSVDSDPIPDNGNIYVYLLADPAYDTTNQDSMFRNFQFDYSTRFNTLSAEPLSGLKTYFEKSGDLLQTLEQDIYLTDGFSKHYRGTIFESNGATITNADWYRYRFNTETQSFMKQNTIAYWENNRYNRNKIDANFYGIMHNIGQAPYPDRIGLHNTIKFVDDDPDRTYAILNLKEIDFAAGTWSATLLEVWDEAKDGLDLENKTFDADVTTGTYNTPQYVPWTAVSLADFTIAGGYQITYNGIVSLNVPIVISLAGNINTTSPAPPPPVTTTFTVKKNATTIKTQTYPVSANPQAFTFNLSPAGNVTIDPGDVFTITVSSNITQIQYTSGGFTIDYQYPGTLTYDPYTEKYIYNS